MLYLLFIIYVFNRIDYIRVQNMKKLSEREGSKRGCLCTITVAFVCYFHIFNGFFFLTNCNCQHRIWHGIQIGWRFSSILTEKAYIIHHLCHVIDQRWTLVRIFAIYFHSAQRRLIHQTVIGMLPRFHPLYHEKN